MASEVRESSNRLVTVRPADGTIRFDRPAREIAAREQTDRDDSGGMVAEATVSRSLPSNPTAVRQARDVVRRVLSAWRADEIFDDVALVASELVANALRHGLRVDDTRFDRPELDGTSSAGVPLQSGYHDEVQISLVSTGKHVICAVTDPSEAPPVPRAADPFAGSGRGLQLVESLSLCWGWTLLDEDSDVPAGRGKSVWAIFPMALARPAMGAA